jgi:hypothetical protein
MGGGGDVEEQFTLGGGVGPNLNQGRARQDCGEGGKDGQRLTTQDPSSKIEPNNKQSRGWGCGDGAAHGSSHTQLYCSVQRPTNNAFPVPASPNTHTQPSLHTT